MAKKCAPQFYELQANAGTSTRRPNETEVIDFESGSVLRSHRWCHEQRARACVSRPSNMTYQVQPWQIGLIASVLFVD